MSIAERIGELEHRFLVDSFMFPRSSFTSSYSCLVFQETSQLQVCRTQSSTSVSNSFIPVCPDIGSITLVCPAKLIFFLLCASHLISNFRLSTETTRRTSTTTRSCRTHSRKSNQLDQTMSVCVTFFLANQSVCRLLLIWWNCRIGGVTV